MEITCIVVLITSEGSVHISQLLEPSQELFHKSCQYIHLFYTLSTKLSHLLNGSGESLEESSLSLSLGGQKLWRD